MDLKENQMQRGLNQALYKYLPLSWIDFYQKADRTAYTAFVTHWNTTKLEGINEKRLFLKINRDIQAFQQYHHVKDFELPMTPENYDIRTPESGLNTDIFTEISPLTFFCNQCGKVYHFRNSTNYLKTGKRCFDCKGTLKQLRLVYACECGWAGPVRPRGCSDPEHRTQFLKFKPPYHFMCTKHPNRIIQIQEYCPSCKKILWPKNPLDLGIYIPFSVTMIDLIKSKKEEFMTKSEDGPKIINGYWLGKLDWDKLNRMIDNSSRKISKEVRDEQISALVKQYTSPPFNFPETQARQVAEVAVNQNNSDTDAQEIIDFINVQLVGAGQKNCDDLAVQVLEYDTVLNAEDVSTLDDAIHISRKLNTNARPEQYKETAEKFGFLNIQVSGNIPFVMCSYGFTRRDTDPAKSVLTGFPSESNRKKNVYGTKLTTEGVLFELDRAKILRWLVKNKFVDPVKDNLPDDFNDDIAVKTWFFNNIDANAINAFVPIDKETYPITSAVYTLIHSMCHSLLRQAAHLCGLDKNSLSEYIFPNIPAFLIYCQNSQGFNIGALFNLFEAYFDHWIKSTKQGIETCIFDPICIDRDHACSGCLFLNEVSCCHFNKDLDRRYLLGWVDKNPVSDERIYGFWEGVD